MLSEQEIIVMGFTIYMRAKTKCTQPVNYKYMPNITNNIHYLENLQTAFLEILSDLNTKQVTNCFHIVNSEQEFSVTW